MSRDKDLLHLRTELFLSDLKASKKETKGLISERLEKSDRKEIEKMIQRAIKSEMKSIEKQRKKEISDFVKSKDFKKAVKDLVAVEIKALSDANISQNDVVEITKKVLVKLYRELAYNYTPVIDRIKI